jgi:hypothetical protein
LRIEEEPQGFNLVAPGGPVDREAPGLAFCRPEESKGVFTAASTSCQHSSQKWDVAVASRLQNHRMRRIAASNSWGGGGVGRSWLLHYRLTLASFARGRVHEMQESPNDNHTAVAAVVLRKAMM